MQVIRRNQPGITRVFPHDGNNRFVIVSSGGKRFNPVDLFVDGEQGAFYSLAPGTVFEDDAMTIPADFGDTVGGIEDQTPNGNDLVQAAVSNRPVYVRHPKTRVRNLLDGSDNWSSGDFTTQAKEYTVSTPDNVFVSLSGTATESFTGPGRVTFTATAGTLTIAAGQPARMQLEEGAAVTNYQSRISRFDVTEAGVRDCYLLWYNGVNANSYLANPMDMSGTSSVAACVGMLAEDMTLRAMVLNQNSNAPASFSIEAPTADGTTTVGAKHRGSGAQRTAGIPGIYDNQDYGMIFMQSDIEAPSVLARLDGSNDVETVTETGAGPYQVQPFALGRNALLATSFFLGLAGPITVCGRVLSQRERLQLEAWTEERMPYLARPPAAITNLAVTAVTGGLRLTWSEPASSTPILSYAVERSADGSTDWAFIGGSGTVNYDDLDAAPGETWFYRVSARNVDGFAPPSNVASGTAWSLPGQVQNLAGKSQDRAAELTWDALVADPAVSGYQVERSDQDGPWNVIVASHPTNSYTDTGLTNLLKYEYRVSAINDAGTGAASDPVSVTPDVQDLTERLKAALGANDPLYLMSISEWWQNNEGTVPATSAGARPNRTGHPIRAQSFERGLLAVTPAVGAPGNLTAVTPGVTQPYNFCDHDNVGHLEIARTFDGTEAYMAVYVPYVEFAEANYDVPIAIDYDGAAWNATDAFYVALQNGHAKVIRNGLTEAAEVPISVGDALIIEAWTTASELTIRVNRGTPVSAPGFTGGNLAATQLTLASYGNKSNSYRSGYDRCVAVNYIPDAATRDLVCDWLEENYV